MAGKYNKFDEFLEDVPKCFGSECKHKAVFKTPRKYMGKQIGYCEFHKYVLADLKLSHVHSLNTRKGMQVKSDFKCWL